MGRGQLAPPKPALRQELARPRESCFLLGVLVVHHQDYVLGVVNNYSQQLWQVPTFFDWGDLNEALTTAVVGYTDARASKHH